MLTVAQSTQRILLLAQGKGEEPRLEFSTSVLDMGPVLPHSAGEETEVLVKNPCPFPIEFYSLEFDKQYLEEERVRFIVTCDSMLSLLLCYSPHLNIFCICGAEPTVHRFNLP